MIDRREFLKMAVCLSAAFGISNFPTIVNAALKKIDPETIPQADLFTGPVMHGLFYLFVAGRISQCGFHDHTIFKTFFSF